MLSRHATREGALDSFKLAESVRSTMNEAKTDGPHSMSLPKLTVAEIFSISTKNQWDYTVTRDIYTSRRLFMTKEDGKALSEMPEELQVEPADGIDSLMLQQCASILKRLRKALDLLTEKTAQIQPTV